MRWILVFLFLYLIPLVVLFRNYGNFKRSCIYSSIYIVLVTSIVTTNIYISGLNKIKEAMYYHNYLNQGKYADRYASNFDQNLDEENITNEEKKQPNTKEEKVENEIEGNSIEESKIIDKEDDNFKESQEMKPIYDTKNKEKTDRDIIFNFKKKIYDTETIALIPMRDCMPYTKNISDNIKNLSNIKDELIYAQEKCEEVIEIYSSMEIPELSKDEYTTVLNNARNDVKKAYELREKAMTYSVKLVETKNPKYVGKITEYLKLSDNHIASFKERILDLNNKIEEN